MALTRLCPASLAGRRALAPRIWGGRAHALIGYPGLRPTSPRTPGRGPARPFHGPLRETRNGHTPVTRAVPFVCIRWTNALSVRSKFHWHEGVILFYAQKYTCTIRLNTDAYLRRVIARRNLRPALHAARRRRGRGRRDVPRRRRRRTSRRPDRTHSHTAHRRGTRPHEHPQ